MGLDTKEGVALFTDGSAWDKDGSGGWAWVAIDVEDGEESGCGYVADTTNNRMEMQAWIEGLNSLYDKYGPCDILVYCDSQLVGRGFTGEYLCKSNLDLWKEISESAKKHRYVEWVWIKGHNGNKYNNKADKLAGIARRTKKSG